MKIENPLTRGIVKGLTVLVLAGAVGYAGFSLWPRSTDPHRVLTEGERVRIVTDRDRKVLKDSKAGEADVYGALIRLAQKKEELARIEAIRRAGHSSALIRAGAGNALGYFQDQESLATLERLLSDSDQNVRIQALNGLGRIPGQEREALLGKVVSSPQSRPEEVLAAWSSLLDIAVTPAKRETALATLIQLASFAGASERNATMAALKVLSFAPRDERVLQLLRQIVKKGTNLALLPVAIRHLGAARDPGISSFLGRLIAHENSQIRSAVLQSLRFSCDPRRFEYFDRVLRTDRDRAVVDVALRELQLMPSDGALKVLEKIVEQKSLPDDQEHRAALNAIVEIRRALGVPGSDPCTMASKTDKSG